MNRIISDNLSEIKQICQLHRVIKAYVFGSVCTENFTDKSDVDFIVKFEKRFFDEYVDNFFSLETQLKTLLNREIDLVAEETIQNPYFIKVVNRTKTAIL